MRAPLHPELESVKKNLSDVFQFMKEKSDPSWYPSLWAEIRKDNTFQVNRRSESLNSDETTGVVLRIFDGHTLFESAHQGLQTEGLQQKALELVQRVKALSSGVKNPYAPPSWKQRLAHPLEDEIHQQIPENPKADTWVHFGVKCLNPVWTDSNGPMKWAQQQFQKLNQFVAGREVDFTAAHLSLEQDHFLFIDSEVRLTQTIYRNLSRLILVKGEDRGRIDRGGIGGLEAIELTDQDFDDVWKKLQDCLKADRLQPGRYKLLMGPAITGVFAHEAFGHTQEGDTWARGRSKAKELYEANEVVGNSFATILNNPAIYQNGADTFGAWGSYFFDEEGWFASEQILVESGFLKKPMTSLTASHRLGVPRSANGKREDWSHGIYTRQTNTYFSAGDSTLDDLLQKMDYGFVAEECAGGMEDPKGMGIQVGIQYVEEVKDGQKTGRTFKGPNGGAIQMTGFVPDYLNQIMGKTMIDPSGVNKDLKHPWNDVGGCGKYHKEFVHAGCGGPYMLVDQALLG